MSPDNEEMMRLMQGLHDNMKREIREGFTDLSAHVDQVITRLDRINDKLDQQISVLESLWGFRV